MIAIFAALVLALLGYLFFAKKATVATTATSTLCDNKPAANKSLKNTDVTSLKLETTIEGKGEQATNGDNVALEYIGRTVDGNEFDTSCNEGRQAIPFTIGSGNMIPGFDGGVVGMRLGEVRRIIIPSELGYGAAEQAGIPANSALIFDVQLVRHEKP